MSAEAKDYLSIKEAAEMLGVPVETVAKLVEKTIPPSKLAKDKSGNIMIHKDAVRELKNIIEETRHRAAERLAAMQRMEEVKEAAAKLRPILKASALPDAWYGDLHDTEIGKLTRNVITNIREVVEGEVPPKCPLDKQLLVPIEAKIIRNSNGGKSMWGYKAVLAHPKSKRKAVEVVFIVTVYKHAAPHHRL